MFIKYNIACNMDSVGIWIPHTINMITDVTNEVNFLRACVQLVDWFGTTMKVHLTDGSEFLNVCKVLGTVRPCAVRCIVLGWLNV
jgi:hypothetical protein